MTHLVPPKAVSIFHVHALPATYLLSTYEKLKPNNPQHIKFNILMAVFFGILICSEGEYTKLTKKKRRKKITYKSSTLKVYLLTIA